jgi:hypothetical protein
MRTTKQTLFLALLLVLALVPLAAAQQGRPNIGQVMIVVKDIDTKAEIASVEPGGTITLPSGSHVRLIMTALPAGRSHGPLYPATIFSDTSAGGVTITRSNAENSTADLVLNRSKAASRTETIRYRIEDNWVPANLRTGSFRVHIAPASAVEGNVNGYSRDNQGYSRGNQGYGYSQGNSNADRLTRMLYQAILLRDPDPGAAGTVESIANGGYNALVQAAVGMANSEESRYRIYDQGTTNEQRLSALYRNLLGVSTSQVDRAQYENDLRRLNQGRIAEVVNDIVSSQRFRDRIGEARY